MKALFLVLALCPALAFADVDPNIQQRIDDATQNTPGGRYYQSPLPDYQPAPRHGVSYVCYARDARGRTFSSSWDMSRWNANSADLNKQYALRRCSSWWNQGCRLVKCEKQRY